MRRARFVGPLLLAVATLAMPTTATAATAAYSIGGQVTDATTGDGVSGICVFADLPGAAQSTAQTTTVAGGAYRLAVPAGTYLVHFIDCRSGAVYASQWYGAAYDRQHAATVSVSATAPVAVGVNAVLQRGSAVSGTVTDHLNGSVLSGICVSATGQNIGQPRDGWPSTTTGTDGTWTLVLPRANYLVDFRDCNPGGTYAQQWWNGASSLADADILTVNVTPNQRITGINAALDHVGTITGRVTDDATGHPLAGICVFTGSGSGETDATGRYTISNVPPGTLSLLFKECQFTVGGPHYAPEWYDHKPNRTVSTAVTMTASSALVVNESMYVGGSITGRVTDATTGQPLSGVQVGVVSSDIDTDRPFTRTAADGTYRLNGLFQSDTYKVFFEYPNGGTINYQSQWWNGAISRDAATPVSVRFNQTTTSIDAAMKPQ